MQMNGCIMINGPSNGRESYEFILDYGGVNEGLKDECISKCFHGINMEKLMKMQKNTPMKVRGIVQTMV